MFERNIPVALNKPERRCNARVERKEGKRLPPVVLDTRCTDGPVATGGTTLDFYKTVNVANSTFGHVMSTNSYRKNVQNTCL